jgi:hypothetical protein
LDINWEIFGLKDIRKRWWRDEEYEEYCGNRCSSWFNVKPLGIFDLMTMIFCWFYTSLEGIFYFSFCSYSSLAKKTSSTTKCLQDWFLFTHNQSIIFSSFQVYYSSPSVFLSLSFHFDLSNFFIIFFYLINRNHLTWNFLQKFQLSSKFNTMKHSTK